MNKDISSILNDWDYEPASINARRITGNDGRPKVQLRLDLGVLQMEVDGRPDGTRPRGYPSLLDYYKTTLRTSSKKSLLDENACADLQQEAVQYYYRYLSLFALQDYEHVVRDTSHNIEIIRLVAKHAHDEDLVWQFLQFFPDVRSMKSRAEAELHLASQSFDKAIKAIDEALDEIKTFWDEYGDEEDAEPSQEEEALKEMRSEIRNRKPRTKEEILREELERAISVENYEKAAQLRDKLNQIDRT